MYKYAIIGSRNIDFDFATSALSDALREKNISLVISGGAVGADAIARNYAIQNSIPLEEFLPDYVSYGSSAPHIRNTLILNECDILVALWDGISLGTASMIEKARKAGKPTIIIDIATTNTNKQISLFS